MKKRGGERERKSNGQRTKYVDGWTDRFDSRLAEEQNPSRICETRSLHTNVAGAALPTTTTTPLSHFRPAVPSIPDSRRDVNVRVCVHQTRNHARFIHSQ